MEKVYDEDVNVGEMLKNLLFPKMCLGCGKIGSYFCPNCSKQTSSLLRYDTICPVCTKLAVGGATHPRCKTKYSPDGLITVFHYDGVIRKAIKMIKYRRTRDLVDDLSTIVTTTLRENKNKNRHLAFSKFAEINNPTIVAVPLFNTRKKERWFNQSEEIGKALANKWNVEFQPDVLLKTIQTKPQAGLKREERLKNIKGAFSTNPNAQRLTPNSSLILFDDVWTTGATMRECVNVLKRGGVRKVWCLTIAR